MPNLFSNANYQGTHVSASYLVPATPPLEGDFVTVWTDISSADLASTKAFWAHLEYSEDNGATWRHYAGFEWTGPTTIQPRMTVSILPLLNKRIRGILDVPERLRLALDYEIGAAPPNP